MKALTICSFLLLTCCILTHSDLSLYYAFTGLQLWYEKMIPALIPFMILSGIMIRMGLTESFISFLYPLVKPIYKVSRNVCYAMFMGFLCGFPMGARTVSDLYTHNLITKREAEFLLSFCNNIGPVYFFSFVLPLLQRQLMLPYLMGMYGIPLLYGIIMRYLTFSDLSDTCSCIQQNQSFSVKGSQLLNVIDDSITSSVRSILSLGGYMILFNLMNLLPHILFGKQPVLLSPLFEISGGLHTLQARCPLYTLILLPFGGLSCIAQTNSCIKNTDLSIANYILHKIRLTGLTALYYFVWFFVSPASFLR